MVFAEDLRRFCPDVSDDQAVDLREFLVAVFGLCRSDRPDTPLSLLALLQQLADQGFDCESMLVLIEAVAEASLPGSGGNQLRAGWSRLLSSNASVATGALWLSTDLPECHQSLDQLMQHALDEHIALSGVAGGTFQTSDLKKTWTKTPNATKKQKAEKYSADAVEFMLASGMTAGVGSAGVGIYNKVKKDFLDKEIKNVITKQSRDFEDFFTKLDKPEQIAKLKAGEMPVNPNGNDNEYGNVLGGLVYEQVRSEMVSDIAAYVHGSNLADHSPHSYLSAFNEWRIDPSPNLIDEKQPIKTGDGIDLSIVKDSLSSNPAYSRVHKILESSGNLSGKNANRSYEEFKQAYKEIDDIPQNQRNEFESSEFFKQFASIHNIANDPRQDAYNTIQQEIYQRRMAWRLVNPKRAYGHYPSELPSIGKIVAGHDQTPAFKAWLSYRTTLNNHGIDLLRDGLEVDRSNSIINKIANGESGLTSEEVTGIIRSVYSDIKDVKPEINKFAKLLDGSNNKAPDSHSFFKALKGIYTSPGSMNDRNHKMIMDQLQNDFDPVTPIAKRNKLTQEQVDEYVAKLNSMPTRNYRTYMRLNEEKFHELTRRLNEAILKKQSSASSNQPKISATEADLVAEASDVDLSNVSRVVERDMSNATIDPANLKKSSPTSSPKSTVVADVSGNIDEPTEYPTGNELDSIKEAGQAEVSGDMNAAAKQAGRDAQAAVNEEVSAASDALEDI